MKEIILNSDLNVVEDANFPEFSQRDFFEIENDFESITNFEGDVVHRNYLDYLSLSILP